MAYFYAGMWFLTGLILIARMGRENRVFYFLGAFFLILGGWWAAGQVTGMNLFTGAWGWALRAVTAAALVLSCWVFVKDLRETRQRNQPKK